MSQRARRLFVWTGAVLGVAILLAAGAVWYTGRPQFCRSCHLMETRYVSWSRSAHAGSADCLDCHAEPGVIGEIKAHLNGARYLWVLATGREQVILRADVPEGTCVKCHPSDELPELDGADELGHEQHYDARVGCATCHKGFHDHVAQGGTLRARLNNCDDCHPATIVRDVPPADREWSEERPMRDLP